jgi:hypothetical protein
LAFSQRERTGIIGSIALIDSFGVDAGDRRGRPRPKRAPTRVSSDARRQRFSALAMLSLLWLAGVLCLLAAFGVVTLVAPLYLVGSLMCGLVMLFTGRWLIRSG